MAIKAKLQDRWLRRWSDENGEVAAVVRMNGAYWLKATTPAWEPGGGEVQYVKFSSMEKAQQEAWDLDLVVTENEQAKIEHDPFFA